MQSGTHFSSESSATSAVGDMNNVFASAGVVIKELYRRRIFLRAVLMTALLRLLLAARCGFSP